MWQCSYTAQNPEIDRKIVNMTLWKRKQSDRNYFSGGRQRTSAAGPVASIMTAACMIAAS